MRGEDDDGEFGHGDVDVNTIFEPEGDSEDSDGMDEEFITADELLKEAAEGLPGGEEMGDERKLRMGRDSIGLDQEGTSSCS